MLDVLGIGVGTATLTLDAVELELGQTVKGTLVLKLTEPIDAKRLVVGVEAKQRVVSTTRDNGIGYSNNTVWRFEKELAGEGRFHELKRKFTLKLPTGLGQASGAPEGVLGEIAQVVSFLSTSKRFPLEWAVFAFLDRPWKVNVKARVGIMVSATSPKKKKAKAKKVRVQSARQRR